MDKSSDCLYFQRNELQKNLMIEICDLYTSTLFLFKEQSYPGRCVVAYKGHVKELFELSEPDRNAFMKDVCLAAEAVQKAFSPAKINYGAYSDKLPHLHFHIVPKQEEGLDFGGTFEMNPQQIYLTESEQAETVKKIVSALSYKKQTKPSK
ncbi:MAG: HIT family protein [Bacteroidota bacterium]|nr:HIT family protein [Bacteroidota bacterium]